MNPDKAWQVSRADAVAMGYEACKKCFMIKPFLTVGNHLDNPEKNCYLAP